MKSQVEKSNNICNRKCYIDLLKVIAIIMVLYNHRGGYYWEPNVGSPVTVFTITKLALAMMCKAGAPLFLIASGILLLGKDESFVYILKHRVSRICIAMIVLAIVNIYKDVSFYGFYKCLLVDLNWYLYAYILFLLMLPFLRNLVKCDDNTKIIFIFMVGIFYAVAGQAIVTNVNPLAGMTNNAQSIFYHNGTHGGWNIVYPVSGYFIYELLNRDDKISSILFKIITILGGCSVFVSILVYYRDLYLTNASNYEMVRQNFIYFPTLSIEAVLVKYNEKIASVLKIKGADIIKSLAELTFGIFLLETCTDIRKIWGPLTEDIVATLKLSDYNKILFKVLFAYIMYSIIVFTIRSVPLVKKIL